MISKFKIIREDNKVIYMRIVIIIFLIFCFLFPNVKAGYDRVYFYSKDEEEEIKMVFVGEYDIGLRVIFGNNCSNYNIEVNSPIFAHPLSGITPEKILAGEIHDLGLDINPNAQIGDYPITVFFNYTNEKNLKVTNQFNFTLKYRKSFEIKELKIPKGKERVFSLTIETFINFTKLKVMYDSDGDIEIKNDEFILENISIGNYTFETLINKIEAHETNAQELGYHIIGFIDSRMIEKLELNIPVRIIWEENSNNNNNNNKIDYIPIIFGISIITLLFVYLFYRFHYFKKNKD